MVPGAVERVVLASASPRRRQLLAELGIRFESLSTGVEERTDGDGRELVLANALAKARAGAGSAGPGAWVIAADTEVVLDGEVLGKAADADSARERLRRLNGRTHEVLGGLAVIDPGGEARTGIESSLVSFGDIPQAQLELYLASGEWRDRAGAYAIQGLGSMLIVAVDGELANVIGLPIGLLMRIAPDLPGLAPAS